MKIGVSFSYLLLIKMMIIPSCNAFSIIGHLNTNTMLGKQKQWSTYGNIIHSSFPRKETVRLGMSLKEDDERFMKLALEYAEIGYGHTFPNPAVGCVLVKDGEKIIGTGFHPRAGYPHAEVFALLQACGYVDSGVDAAISCLPTSNSNDISSSLQSYVEQYIDDPKNILLDDDKLTSMLPANTTAYVTLEPCCHNKKSAKKRTPPCAQSLLLANIARVVIGQVDPNPQVDGGGIQLFQNNDIPVQVMSSPTIKQSCRQITSNFIQRQTTTISSTLEDGLTGPQKSTLRSIAGRWKQEDIMTSLEAPSTNNCLEAPSWLEQVDTALWKHELIVLRLNKVCKKKKEAKELGTQIAQKLGHAFVVQTLGHTVLLYRPIETKPKVPLSSL